MEPETTINDTLIDLKPIFGEPYINRTVETVHTDGAGTVISTTVVTEQVKNLEFVANGFIFTLVLLLFSNILLRTVFPKRRG